MSKMYFTSNLEKLNAISFLLFLSLLTVIALVDLTVAFVSMLASYYIVSSLTQIPLLSKHASAKKIATVIIGAALVFWLILGVTYGTDLVKSGLSLYSSLRGNLAPHILTIKAMLPSALSSLIPTNEEHLNQWGQTLVENQAVTVIKAGASMAEGFLMAIIGIIIGLVLANTKTADAKSTTFSKTIIERGTNFYSVFKKVVLAQFWIALINTTLTSVFILIILPLFGKHIPYAAAIIVFTFVAGLIPIVGNLACNVVLTVAGLSQGLPVAVACLVWLMAIHKLEYIINAKVLGTQTNIATWELLSVIFIAHSLLGVQGLVLGPLYYSYVKSELKFAKII